jgi:predicted transcriptional regulator
VEDRYVLTEKGETALQQSIFAAYVDGYMKRNNMTKEEAIAEINNDLAVARAQADGE